MRDESKDQLVEKHACTVSDGETRMPRCITYKKGRIKE